MRVVSLSECAMEWLAVLDPDPEWLESPDFSDESPPDVLVVSDGNEAVPVAWAHSDRAPRMVSWNPSTLKSVMDNALRLARYTDRLPQLMRILGEKERSIRILQQRIGGTGPANVRPSAVCLCFDGKWMVLGGWVPDLIDRAGGVALLLESGDPPIIARSEDFLSTQPNVICIAMERGLPDGQVFMDRTREFLAEISFSGRAYLVPSERILSSGPVLYDTVFELAAALYPENTGLNENPTTFSRIDLRNT